VVQIHRETTSTISDVPLTSDLPNQASISDKVGPLPSDSTAEQYLEHFFTAMNNLANTLGDQGKLEEAAAMKEVLEKRQRILRCSFHVQDRSDNQEHRGHDRVGG
jgi:hypothetical protein